MEGVNRQGRNTLRQAIMKAEEGKVISQSEGGFIVTLVERFRQEIEMKQRKIMVLQGELAQLQANEKIIIDMIENITAAAERDRARRETLAKLKGEQSEDSEVLEPEENEYSEETSMEDDKD